jgi:hypothetical protein
LGGNWPKLVSDSNIDLIQNLIWRRNGNEAAPVCRSPFP